LEYRSPEVKAFLETWTPDSDATKGLSKLAIFGISAASCAVIVIIIFTTVLVLRKKHLASQDYTPDPGSSIRDSRPTQEPELETPMSHGEMRRPPTSQIQSAQLAYIEENGPEEDDETRTQKACHDEAARTSVHAECGNKSPSTASSKPWQGSFQNPPSSFSCNS
jgi:hypothetical protein